LRRIGLLFGVTGFVCAVAGAATVMWVDRALATTLDRAEVMCLTPPDRAMIAHDAFPDDRKDHFVSQTVNFKLGVPKMLWWHLRGATIQLTYETFWSPSKRDRIFDRVTSRMRDCPPD